jgi:hypothetical protein
MLAMTMTETLRKAIKTGGFTRYAIRQATGIDQAALMRFMRGKTITLETADCLAEFFNLRLAPAKEKKSTGR